MRAIVFANGTLNRWPAGLTVCSDQDLILAADGGVYHCRNWNLTPRVIVGDMDSVDPEVLQGFAAGGSRIVHHPVEKDETDLELALRLAMDLGARDIVILGAMGGRWDMTLSSMLILTAPFLAKARVRILDGPVVVFCVRTGRGQVISGRPGDRLSILPISGPASGITLEGLRYPLKNATLAPGSTRGVSNAFVENQASIRLKSGRVLVVVTQTGDTRAEPDAETRPEPSQNNGNGAARPARPWENARQSLKIEDIRS